MAQKKEQVLERQAEQRTENVDTNKNAPESQKKKKSKKSRKNKGLKDFMDGDNELNEYTAAQSEAL